MKRGIEKKRKNAACESQFSSNSDEEVNNSDADLGNERRLLMAINHLNRPDNGRSSQLPSEYKSEYKGQVLPQMDSVTKETEIDEDVLNRLLKSNDFKASRLIKSTSRPEVSGKKMAKVDFYDAELLDLINDLND